MPVAIATAAQLAPPGQKGRALSIAGGGISAAWLLGVPLGAVLVDYFGWRVSFVLAATLAILASIAVRALLPKVRSVPSTGGLRSPLAVTGRPLVLITLVVTILAMVSGFTVLTYMRSLLEGLTGFGGEGIGSMLLLFGLAAVLGSVLGGYGADRWGYRASIIPMLILQALVLLLFSVLSVLGAASAVTIVVAAAAVATWGVVGFALVPLQQYRMIEVAPDEQNGVLSLNSSAVYAGQGLGAGLGSLVLGHASLASLGYVGALLAVAALTVFLLGTRALAKGPSQKKGIEPARIPYSK
jgi:predicted MFS family arabinose efflux permease